MPSNRPLRISELKAVLPVENGEPLIDLAKENWGIVCRRVRCEILIRKSAAEKLQRIQERLQSINSQLQLVVAEGYRHPDIQEQMYLHYFCELARKYPEMEEGELKERVHQWVALPSVAGHPTGGAVDVTLAEDGEEVDMGGGIADFSCPEKLATFASSLSTQQRQWRKLLLDLMLAEGFAPFYGEWWHYSYGDREWAAFYGHSRTRYASLSLKPD